MTGMYAQNAQLNARLIAQVIKTGLLGTPLPLVCEVWNKRLDPGLSTMYTPRHLRKYPPNDIQNVQAMKMC